MAFEIGGRMLGGKKFIVLALFGISISSVWMIAAQRGAPPAGQAAPGGQQRGQGAPAGQQRGGQAGGGRGQRGDAPPAPTGLTVTGEIPNYVPVTDEMLKKPDPGDWLMIRRDYSATDFSPLNQITPA